MKNNESFLSKLMQIILCRRQISDDGYKTPEKITQQELPYNFYKSEQKAIEFSNISSMVRNALSAFDSKRESLKQHRENGSTVLEYEHAVEENPFAIVPYQQGDEDSDYVFNIKKCRKPKVQKQEKLTKANLKKLNTKKEPEPTEQALDEKSSIQALIGTSVIFDQTVVTPEVTDPTCLKRKKRAAWEATKTTVPCNTYINTPQKSETM